MGIFDAFTGAPVEDAAERNAQLARQYKTDAFGYFDTALPKSEGAFGNAIGAFGPLQALGAQFGRGTNLYQDALGINGPEGAARATSSFQASPGYQFALTQGLQALDRGAAGRGMLTSGNTRMAEMGYGQGLADQEYGNWLGRLGGFVNPQLQATGAAATGTAAANTGLAGLYQGDASNRANVAGSATALQAQSNMQAAQAEMQGNAALWNMGMQLALGGMNSAGKAGGFSKLFG